MFRRLLLLLALLLLPLPAAAQSLDGDWNGTLVMPNGAHLRILFEFQKTKTGLRVSLVHVDLRRESFAADTASLQGKNLTITVPVVDGAYQGTLSDDGEKVTGTWTQRGRSLPLDLVPGTITALVLHKPDPGDLTIKTPTGTLAGTILRAGNGKLAAVIITGAGPANRDGDSPVNGGSGTYRDIAEGLGAHGITTLRFDKRGVGQSAAAMRREDDLRIQTYGDDTRAWAAELKRRTGASCVWLVGHSEGAFIAELAADNNPDICGIVTLAGVGRSFYAGWREAMMQAVPADQLPPVLAALDTLKAGRPVPNPPPQMMGAFRPSIQAYMISEFEQDPSALLHRLKVPVLIVQGDADRNVSVADAKALAAARPDATLKILPGVDHNQRLAKDDPGFGPGLLAPGEMDMIADFLHEHSP